MTTRELLVKARALIEDPDNWTQGMSVKEVQNAATGEIRKQYCARGALAEVRDKSGANDWEPFRKSAMRKLREAIGGRNVVVFNDRYLHRDVLGMFDRGISLCE